MAIPPKGELDAEASNVAVVPEFVAENLAVGAWSGVIAMPLGKEFWARPTV